MAQNPTVLQIKAKIDGLKGLNQLKASLRKIGTEAVNSQNVLKGYTAEIVKFSQKTGNSINALEAQKRAFEALRRSVDITSDEFKQAGLELEKLDKKLAKAEGRKPGTGRLRSAAQSVGAIAGAGVFGGPEGAIGAALGAFGGPQAAIVGGAIGAQVGQLRQALGATAEYAAELKKLRVALQGVTTSNEEYANALQVISGATKDYAIPQEVLTRQFTKLQASVQGAGGNINDTKTAFNGIVAAVRATGGSLQDVDSALTATAQVFSKGKVSAEELRQQIGERLPGAFSIFAQSIGKTPQELDKALEKGQVSLQDFQTFSEALFERYGENAKIIASGPESAGDRLKVALSELSKSVGDLLSPIGVAFQEVFSKIVESITKATKALNAFFGVTDDAKVNKNTLLIQTINKNLFELRRNRKQQLQDIEKEGDFLGQKARVVRDIELSIKSQEAQREKLRSEINQITRRRAATQRPTEGSGLPGITPGLSGDSKSKTKGPERADFSVLEGIWARDAALRVQEQTAKIQIEIAKAEAEGNKRLVFALEQKQEMLKINQIIESLEVLTQKRAVQIAEAQSRGLDVTGVQNKQLDDQNNLLIAIREQEALSAIQELERLKFEKQITAELDKQRKSFEDQFLDRQKELGLISPGEYNQVLMKRERDRLADPKLGLTSQQQARGLEQYRQIIDPTPSERLAQNIRSLKEELEELVDPINQITGAANAIGTAFSQSFTDAISGSKSTKEALADFFKSVGSYFLDMAGQIIAKMITISILNSIAKVLPGSAGSSGFNLAGFGNLAPDNASGVAGFLSGALGARANGGPVIAGQPYLIGERGPEIMIPFQSGTVIPNEQSEELMAAAFQRGGASSTNTNNFGGNSSSVSNSFQQMQAVNLPFTRSSERIVTDRQERETIAAINNPAPLNVRFESQVINGVEYVTAEQHRQGMAQAAEQGRALTLSALQNSVKTRKKVGI